jgi:signal transduction histidine kinase
MKKHEWKEKGSCYKYDTNIFFEKYENDLMLRPAIDKLCSECPVMKECFSVGITQKEWGVWGGIYLEQGEISREFNNHKTKPIWANIWQTLTMGTSK